MTGVVEEVFLISVVEFFIFVAGVVVVGGASVEPFGFRALTSFGAQQPEVGIIVEIRINSKIALSFIADTTPFFQKNKPELMDRKSSELFSSSRNLKS